MEKQEYSGPYAEIETIADGTYLVPIDEVGEPGAWDGSTVHTPDAGESDIVFDNVARFYRDYVPGGSDSIRSIGRKYGTLYRISMPDYLDCTEWTTDPDLSR